MSRQPRRNRSPGFKAKGTLAPRNDDGIGWGMKGSALDRLRDLSQ